MNKQDKQRLKKIFQEAQVNLMEGTTFACLAIKYCFTHDQNIDDAQIEYPLLKKAADIFRIFQPDEIPNKFCWWDEETYEGGQSCRLTALSLCESIVDDEGTVNFLLNANRI